MTGGRFSESVVEDAALAWLESLGYAVKHLPAPQNDTTRQAAGPDKSPTGDTLTLAPSTLLLCGCQVIEAPDLLGF